MQCDLHLSFPKMMLPLMLAIAGAPELKESVGCGTGMYVYNPGCGMESPVEGIFGDPQAGCEQCMRILVKEGNFEGCEEKVSCEQEGGGFLFGGGSKVIFMKALGAPSPPPLPPTPPTMPPPEEDLWDEYCPDDVEKDECKQKAAIAGGAATVCVLAIVVVGASKKGGSVPQL